jgi:hypothetical protein
MALCFTTAENNEEKNSHFPETLSFRTINKEGYEIKIP